MQEITLMATNKDKRRVNKRIYIKLTIEFTFIIRLGEPLIRDGRSSTESRAGAR